MNYIELQWITMNYIELQWITMNYIELHWITLNYIELHWITLNTTYVLIWWFINNIWYPQWNVYLINNYWHFKNQFLHFRIVNCKTKTNVFHTFEVSTNMLSINTLTLRDSIVFISHIFIIILIYISMYAHIKITLLCNTNIFYMIVYIHKYENYL